MSIKRSQSFTNKSTQDSDDDEDFEHLDIEEFKEEEDETEPTTQDSEVEAFPFDWEEIEQPSILKRPVIIAPKISPLISDDITPLELFNMAIGNKLWDLLVNNTNQYANSFLGNEDTQMYMQRHPESTFHRWKDTNKNEMMKFILILLSMAIAKRGNIKDHWESSPCFPSKFAEIMGSKRFQTIDHFFQINCGVSENDKSMFKIAPLTNIFAKFNDLYKPSSVVCIDEIIAPFSGKFKYISYNPRKPERYGIKIVGMADSITGYCLNLLPTFGRETYNYLGVDDLDGLIVHHMKKFCMEGSSLYIDNFYCHFNLAQKLLHEGFNTTGTFRMQRKDVPQIIRTTEVKKFTKKMKKDGKKTTDKSIRFYRSNTGIYALKWCSTKEVCLLTTNHSMEMEEVTTARDREVERPRAISEYIKYMRGIDRLNQRVQHIRYAHKNRKWWKKYFYTWLAIAIANCHVIYTKFLKKKRNMSTKDFQCELIRELLQKTTGQIEMRKNLANNHYPVKILTSNAKRCKVCYYNTKDSTCHKSSYKCYQCSLEAERDIALCVLCFKEWHDDREKFISQGKGND